MSIEFAADLGAKNVKRGILDLPGAPHIHDLNLHLSDKKRDSGVLPGFEFLK